MAQPILSDKDLDALISSDTYVPESGVIEDAAITTISAAVELPDSFRSLTEMNTTYLSKKKIIVTEETNEVELSNKLPDAAIGSFGEELLELVIMNDDRKKVKDVTLSPFRKIAALIITSKTGSKYAGTAWFISPRVLVTAGHCVFLQKAGGFAQSIEVVPAYNGANRPYGTHTATLFKASNGWVNDRNSDYDYGLIILDEPAHPSIGWFAFAAPNDEVLNKKVINVCGYPYETDKWPNQYYHAREISRSSMHKVYYDADSSGGQSGAGLWMTLGEDERVVIGIHTNGGSTTNYGARITEKMFQNFKTVKNEYQ